MNIDELHDKLFDVLCVIDEICRENNLTYYLDSGTELGSVREKDFIAWDDDMDLKIKAEDYPRFKAVMAEKLPPYMHIAEPYDFAPYFYDFVIRIYDERYLLREETAADKAYNNLQNHVGTDVFLMVKAPADTNIHRYMKFKTKILYGLGMGHRFKIDFRKYTGIQKLQVIILSGIGKLVNTDKIIKKWFLFINRCQKCNGEYRFTSNYSLKHLSFYPNDWLCTGAYGEIRGKKFPIPKEYDKELTLMYGDYHKPPENKDDYVHHLY